MNSKQEETLRTPTAYWKGLFYLKMRNWPKAEKYFSVATRTSPKHAESWFKHGFVRVKQAKWEGAFSSLLKALVLHPKNAIWMQQFRNVERRLDVDSPSLPLLSEKEIQARIETSGESAFLYSQLARTLRRQSRWWLELEALKAAVAQDGEDELLRFRFGYALARMKRFGEAAEQYKRAVELRPGNGAWYYHLGCALATPSEYGSSDPKTARRYFDMAVAAQKSKHLKSLGIGAFHQDAENWSLAAEAFEEKIREEPENARLHFFLGDARQHLYQWTGAVDAYRRAVALNDERPKWHYRLGLMSERLGDFTTAAEAYAMAIHKNPDPMPLWNYRLGYALERIGRFPEAREAYEKSLEDAPTTKTTAGIGNARTINEIRRVLDSDVTDPADWRELGVLLEEQQEWTDAAAAYDQAVSRSKLHDPNLYHRRGRCLAEAGLLEAACASFRSVRILQRPHGVSQSEFRSKANVRRSASYTEYHEILEIDRNKILYESFHGKQMSCNPYALFLHMLERPEFAEHTHVWVINNRDNIPEKFKNRRNVIFIPNEGDGYLRHLTTAAVLINNATFPTYFIRKEGQIYLNTWHGTPWKNMGQDVASEPINYGNVARNLLHSTHVLSPNPHTTRVLMDRFGISGLFTGILAETGYPRIDVTLNLGEAEKDELKRKLGISGKRKVVLYAPTWRGTLGNKEDNTNEVGREIERLMGTGCQLLFRGHMLGVKFPENVCVPENIPTNELLAITDILVTDYSSISFDFMATGRPVLLYLPDYEKYKRERGLYFGPEQMPDAISYNLDDLCESLAAHLQDSGEMNESYAAAKQRFCPHEDGRATERAVDLIFSAPEEPRATSAKRKVLIFSGTFEPNGVTTSLLNLLQNLDHAKVQVTLAVEPSQINRTPERQEQFGRLPAEIEMLPRTGTMDLTVEERWVMNSFNKHYCFHGSPMLWEIYRRAYAREYVRLFGRSHFDAAVEFTGYSSFWTSVFGFAPEDAIDHRAVYQHSDKFSEWATRFPQLEQMFRLYAHSDRLISVSETTRNLNVDSLAERFNLPKSKFDFCNNMLNPARVIAAAEPPLEEDDESRIFSPRVRTFISVGRLSVEKDHDKLIRAFALLRESRPDTQLLIVGDGPLFQPLKRLVNNLGLVEHVYFTGYRKNPFPYLKRADCFILSSNYEGQPLVLFEAMILGKPIISTDIASCRSVVENRSGRLVDNSIDGLVNGMKEFCDGGILAVPVDFTSYQREAMNGFYMKSCNLTI